MSYHLRVLPPDEWDRIEEPQMKRVLPYLIPEDTRLIVVEHEGRIVGLWAAIKMVHLEGVWIDPAERGKVPIVRKLLQGIWSVARGWNARTCWTGATNDDVRTLIRKLGGEEVACTSYLVPVPGEPSCR